MQCMKCGRDLKDDQVFCDICREDMKNYPVKPGTVVLLPHYVRYSAPKKPAKRIIPLDEQLRRSKKVSRILGWLMALFLAAALALGYLSWYLYNEYKDKFLPGQNYSVAETTENNSATDSGEAN